MSGDLFSEFARHVKRGEKGAWTQRDLPPGMHMGTVSAVDLFNGVVSFQTPDPSGLVIPGVRFIQAYSAVNPPQVGHVVWAQNFGTNLMVLGQHVVQTNSVTPT